MLEQQFIHFSTAIPDGHEFPVPACMSGGTEFYASVSYSWESYCSLTTPDGTLISEEVLVLPMSGMPRPYAHICLFGDADGALFGDALSYMAIGDCFRVRIRVKLPHTDSVVYSNLLRLTEPDGLSLLRYKCNEDEFGFPFGSGTAAAVWLPLRLTAPQFKQNDKRYIKLDGTPITLYATINKEYSGETDYIPEEWHEKIVTALSCDEVEIDGKKLYKSDTYDIDWDNFDIDEDSGVKIARATFKMKENVITRNSNV